MFPILAGNSASTGYNLTRSLRFRNSASAYLSRTPASAGNRSVWTWSGWVKRGKLGTLQGIFGAGNTSGGGPGATYITGVTFNGSDQLFCYWGGSGAGTSTAVFRDPSAWYHLVVVANTTTLTCYMNNVSVLSNSISGSGAINDTQKTTLGSFWDTAGGAVLWPNDIYMTEVNFVDGQALTPSSFGSYNSATGVWQPARYSGTYGTNGFYLPFTDNSALTTSSNVGLGKDFSGNGNYWTTNNISITAGVTYDSMTDVPTLTSATAANFAVLNPVNKGSGGVTISDGNLAFTSTATTAACRVLSTIGMSTGKWYCEYIATSSSTLPNVGIAISTDSPDAGYVGATAGSYGYYALNGNKYNNGSNSAYGATFNNGDVIGIAFDASAGSLTFYKNGTSQGVAFTGIPAGTYYFGQGDYTATFSGAFNFGQQPFTYTPPTGYVALNTYNLPTSTIVKGNTVMDATLYTGTLLSNAITNAASFKPDLVWVKSRSAATDNKLTDSVRGTTKGLVSNSTAAETTDTQGLTAFGSAGFTVGTNTDYNNLSATYVAWQWQAGQGSTSSNTNGTITSTVSVNASAGFSVATWTGTGALATVGHGLGVAPSFIIVKNRSSALDWPVYTSYYGINATLALNTTAAGAAAANYWGSALPTSSVFGVGTSTNNNGSGNAMLAYCWTPIAGYSAFGSFVGNGTSDNTFVYTGFRPKFVMIKPTSGAGGDWIVQDTARDPYNVATALLNPNLSGAEYTSGVIQIDFLSNGFKVRGSWGGYTLNPIYAAFAETPFKNSLAR
jgi:hypothetical protein